MQESARKKILVIEDEPMLLKALEFKLTRDGFEVLLAADGKQALKMIKENEPDIVVTDIMLPYLNGLEIINYIKKEITKKTGTIVLSKVGLEKTVVEAFELGADDFVAKPFSPNELTIRIRKLLK